jgi:thiamine biosynthesis lipoprotein
MQSLSTQAVMLVVIALVVDNLGGTGSARATRFEFTEVHMGTRFRIVLYARNSRLARAASRSAMDRIAALDATMSDYRDTSELNRVCAEASRKPIRISEDLFRVFSMAERFSELTGGAFDVTAGPLVRLWRRARRTGELPDSGRLTAARQSTGYRLLRLDQASRTVTLGQDGMRIDLGGIAKGYAADRALEDLRRFQITSALVAAGGDIAAGSPPPGKEGWRVGVSGGGREAICTLLLKNRAISTSGDMWQYVELDGARYSHIVDPRTGQALTGRRSATVVASDSASADALATAVCVLGATRGLQLVDSIGAAALFHQECDGDKSTYESARWSTLPRDASKRAAER